MAGIYIHIPFCKQACHYCNFHFSTSKKNYEQVLKAILAEIELRLNYLPNNKIDSIYFGGGTPSVLAVADVEQILHTINKNYNVNPKAEITFESNPDDISLEKLKAWKSAGINRLSIGVQSFFEDDLKWMNRAHSSRQAEDAINLSRQAGFTNITADLIYGLPHNHWEANIKKMVEFVIPHLSSYALMVEEKTALHHFVTTKKVQLPPDEKAEEDYQILCEYLKKVGYEHYEISNFAKPGFRSKHNASYWKGTPYLGIGPAAHSYNGKTRRWNIANNTQYANGVLQNTQFCEDEVLSLTDQYNEFVMTGLRKVEGILYSEIETKFGEKYLQYLTSAAAKFLETKKLIFSENRLYISEREWFLADTIIAELFFVSES